MRAFAIINHRVSKGHYDQLLAGTCQVFTENVMTEIKDTAPKRGVAHVGAGLLSGGY